jgi:hypothetical protein
MLKENEMPDEKNLAIEENRRNEKDTIRTGSDLPNADGNVADEDVNKITNDRSDQPTGRDHSTENYGQTMPDHGVGAVQDNSDTTSDIARIDE